MGCAPRWAAQRRPGAGIPCLMSRAHRAGVPAIRAEDRAAQSAEPRLALVVAAEAGLAGTDDRLGAIGDAELVEDVRDVVSNGLVGDLEACRDLMVRPPLRDQLQDLVLTLRELRERIG